MTRKGISVTDTEDYKSLLFEQKLAFHGALAGHNIVVTGGGGVGKSHFIRILERHHKGMILCASTGIAAINIGGITLDSFMGFGGHALSVESAYRVKKDLREKLSQVTSILIDEASMTRIDRLECVSARLQTAKGNKKPFGGVQLILVGDFCQLKPIIGRNQDEKAIFFNTYGRRLYAFESDIYQEAEFTPYLLSNYVRQGNEEQRRVLRNLRMGRKIPDAVRVINQMATGALSDQAIYLCPTNKKAEEVNDVKFKGLTGRARTYFGKEKNKVSTKPVPDLLELKVGARVMICANHADNGYYNGDLGIVVEMGQSDVLVNLDRGISVRVEKNEWKEYDYNSKLEKEEIGSYTQMPIKLAYAITIHKSQGMTLEHVTLDLNGVFTEGMAYVGLSRIRCFSNLHLIRPVRAGDVKSSRAAIEFTMAISTAAMNRQKEDAKRFGVPLPKEKEVA